MLSYNLVVDYIKKFKRIPKSRVNYKDNAIGDWVRTQIDQKMKDKLSDANK